MIVDLVETGSPVPAPAGAVTFRGARRDDAHVIKSLVEASGVLEPNTCYAYLLLCTHFAETCVVAELDGEVVGFVVGYKPPGRPDAVFVWQIGVSTAARGRGVGRRLLLALLERPGCRDVNYLEATVATDNLPSRRLFESLARARSAPCHVTPGFAGADFGPLEHEDEELFRIGPFRKSS